MRDIICKNCVYGGRIMLIQCSECGKGISDKATSCPNCGNPVVIQQNIIIKNEQHIMVNTVGLDICFIVSMILSSLFGCAPDLKAILGFLVPILWYVLYSIKESALSKDPKFNIKHLTNMKVISIIWLILNFVLALLIEIHR